MRKDTKKGAKYFLHPITPERTVRILEHKWGNDGYAFWFKLLELLCDAEDHVLHVRHEHAQELLACLTLLPIEKCHEILKFLADIKAIDRALWKQHVIKVSEQEHIKFKRG